MNFHSPLSFLFLIGLIPIILMYLLKKQHKEQEISSTYLWERAIKDMEANKPWQKLKKNILMILQIIIFTLIVFILAQPYISSYTFDSENLIIVLDKSASMQSTDVDENRFTVAKNEISKMIDNIKSENVTLITMGKNAEVVASKTKDKSLLKRKLKDIEVSNATDSIEQTVSLVRAMVKNMNDYKVIFYTDKEINLRIDNAVINNISENNRNLAIERISHSKSKDKITVLTTITNYSETEEQMDLVLYIDNEIYQVKEIDIKANETKNYYFDDIPENINVIKAEIDIDDNLMIDNFRYHIVNSNPNSKVLLLTKENIFLEKALLLSENIELFKSDKALENLEGYELYIFDGMLPEKLPTDGNIIVFDVPLDNQIVEVKNTINSGELKLKDDDLFNYVDLDFNVGETKIFKNPKWGIPVLTTDDNPIIIKGQKLNQKFVVVGFDIHNTDFPLRMGFPIFIQNVLDYSLNLGNQSETSILSGENIDINVLPKTTEVYLIEPDEEKIKLAPPFPLETYENTLETGVYTIEQKYNNQVFKSYFVSNIDTIYESGISIGSEVDLTNNNKDREKVKVGKNLKSIFIYIALILLAIEWMVYSRGY